MFIYLFKVSRAEHFSININNVVVVSRTRMLQQTFILFNNNRTVYFENKLVIITKLLNKADPIPGMLQKHDDSMAGKRTRKSH